MAGLAILCALVPAGAFGLTLRFTASLNGSLDGCDCKLTPRAGLVKLAAWLRPAHRPGVDLLVDGGDLFGEGRDELLERHLLESYAELGYAAIAVGERELEAGADTLLALRDRFPLLSNNLTLRVAGGTWVAFGPDPRLVNLGGTNIAILSLIGPEALADLEPGAAAATRVEPPSRVAARLLASERVRSADLVVLLYHGELERARELMKGLRGVDVTVVAHEQKLVSLERAGDAVLVSPGEAGNRVGELEWSDRAIRASRYRVTFRSFRGGFGPDDSAVRGRIDSYEQELRSRLTGARG